MKKLISLVLVLALALSVVAVLPIYASATTGDGIIDNADYTKVDGGSMNYINIDAEGLSGADLTGDSVSGAYINPAMSYDVNTTTPINGAKSLTTTLAGANAGSTAMMDLKTGSFKGEGTYYVSFSFRSDKATLIAVEVRKDWGSDEATSFLADFRYTPVYTDGVITNAVKETGGFTGANQLYTNEIVTVTDGVVNVYFEYTITATDAMSDPNLPGTTLRVANPADTTVEFDDIRFGQIGEDKYFTTAYDKNGDDDCTAGEAAWDSQPFWANDMSWETDAPLDGTASYRIGFGVTDNTRIGGIDTVAPAKKMFVKNAYTKIEFDIDVIGASMVNIWSGTVYTALIYEGVSWRSEGAIVGLTATELPAGGMRVSYCIDAAVAGVATQDYNINTSSAGGGYILLDNIHVSYEDYSPVVEGGAKYNLVNTANVAIDADLKGGTLTSLEKDVEGTMTAVDSANYTYVDGLLTINANQFDTTKDSTTFQLNSNNGSTQFVVKKYDNRTAVTGVTASGAITKAYDGTDTATLGTVTLTLIGVASGDDVGITGTFTYDASDVTATKVVLTNATLTGDDADNYTLGTTTFDLTGSITPLQLTVSGTVVTDTKEYDGANTATVTTVGDLGNVVSTDAVTVKATAVYNSADVATANNVTATYTIEGADVGNYTAPVAQDFTATITKKALTVVAKAVAITEGDAEPTLEYTATGLVGSDALTGKLAREAGVEAGEYDINVGTLANANYTINFTKAVLTINEAPANNTWIWIVIGAVVVVAVVVLVVSKRKKTIK